ncbi:hypothetical protein GCM10012275_53960 [Longimycelium tulufanense]|uniref:Uncharacterized protein n=1 Tax=Longimycelium tulufanense TaxID=907463 RepID=A0A8J3FYJ9_9PSEU|nr:hypothetical protein [Longimycelium tulufanense]GGM76403.1 hypothetical protein GCM10012275_53960 [Longimycelium tulufanense]
MTEFGNGQPSAGVGGVPVRGVAGWAATPASSAAHRGEGQVLEGQHRPHSSGGETVGRPVLPIWAELADRQPQLAQVAYRAIPGAVEQDVAGVIDTASTSVAQAAVTRDLAPEGVRELADHVAAHAAEVVRSVAGDATTFADSPRIDWRALGLVLPVLGAGPGVGASVVAAVLTDALSGRWSTLLVDPADPARSGLAEAAPVEGPRRQTPHPAVRLCCSRRGPAVLARLECDLPILSPGLVPAPPWWIPPAGSPQVTVVDVGHDAWRLATNPLSGAGVWLRHGLPAPRPILVARPTRPSLLAAEQVLARLEPWVHAGLATPVRALVVVGARKWPPGVVGAAGRRLAALVESAVFLPPDAQVARGGVSGQITPARLRQAVEPLLAVFGLAPTHDRPGRGRRERRR